MNTPNTARLPLRVVVIGSLGVALLNGLLVYFFLGAPIWFAYAFTLVLFNLGMLGAPR